MQEMLIYTEPNAQTRQAGLTAHISRRNNAASVTGCSIFVLRSIANLWAGYVGGRKSCRTLEIGLSTRIASPTTNDSVGRKFRYFLKELAMGTSPLFSPNPDQSQVSHLRLVVQALKRSDQKISIYVSCGDVGLPISLNPDYPHPIEVGDILYMEFPKGANPLTSRLSAIYPEHLKPAKEKPMSNFIVADGQTVTMTSLEIADLVDSRHDKVKQSIERLASRAVIELPPMGEIKTATKPMSVYKFSGEQGKRDSIIVVAQLSPEFTARLVDRWKELEKQIAQRDPMDLLNDPTALRQTLLGYTEKVIALEEKVQEQMPKVEAFNKIADSVNTFCLRDAAKALQIRPNKLNQWLQMNGWIYRRAGKGGFIAYQERIQAGHLTHKVTPYVDENTGDDKVSEQVRVTGKGLALLAKRLNEDGYVPNKTARIGNQQAMTH